MNHKGIRTLLHSPGIALGTVLLGLFSLTCDYPAGQKLANTTPETRLANIPPDDTVAVYISEGTVPEFRLNWIGDDQDGYLISYRFRWTTIVRGTPVLTTPWTTLLNLTEIAGLSVGSPILVVGTPSSYFRIFNFLGTLNPVLDSSIVRSLFDSLDTGRRFAVPYKAGIVPGDSIVASNPLTLQAPTKGTFIFFSPTDSNMHRFEVLSIDNDEALDPTAATVHFWTIKSQPPQVWIDPTRLPPDNGFVLPCKTETFRGLRFYFLYKDPSTFDQLFSWVVDDTIDQSRWSPWSADASALVDASNFIVPGDTHTIFVRCINRFGVLSDTIAWRRFRAQVPPFSRPGYPSRILVINNNKSGPPPTAPAPYPDSLLTNNYYSTMLDAFGYQRGRDSMGYDIWVTQTKSPVGSFPSLTVLGNYSSVLLTSEQRMRGIPFASYSFTITKQDLMKFYLFSGGKLIFIAPQLIDTYVASYMGVGGWADTILHVNPFTMPPFLSLPNWRNDSLDFFGARGATGYPDMPLDTTKLRQNHAPSSGDSLYSLRSISLASPRGFAEVITLFDSRTNNPTFEGRPLGLRFLAPNTQPPGCRTYSVVFFGFPIFYAQEPAARAAMRRALVDLGEIPN